MDSEFVAPFEAINRLMKMHYPGRKRGDPKRVRMALIGALRSGQVEWRCQRWLEKYWTDSGAEFDENGGWTTNVPREGWPPDFWQSALAADAVCWKSNYFNTFGFVSLRTAPRNVLVWLERNGVATADWQRAAERVEINWTDVSELLSEPGWQVWKPQDGNSNAGVPKAAHYQSALIRMIARVRDDPSILNSRRAIDAALFEEFDFGGKIPDEAQLRRLVGQIWNASQPIEDPPATTGADSENCG